MLTEFHDIFVRTGMGSFEVSLWIYFSEILTGDAIDVINALSYSVVVKRRQVHVGVKLGMQNND